MLTRVAAEKGAERLKIVLNALSARQGGGQTYVRNLLRSIPADLDTRIFLLAPQSFQMETEDERIVRIPGKPNLENPVTRTAWERVRLPGLIRDLGAGVLFCPGGVVGAAPPKDCKVVTVFQNMLPFDKAARRKFPPGYSRFRHWILNSVLLNGMAKSNLVIFGSEFARELIEKQLPGISGRSVIIPNGIDPVFRMSSNSRPHWLPQGKYLLYVSILDYYKAQIEVLRAFALLRERRRTNETLVLVGPERPGYGQMVRDEIVRLNLKDSVILAGAVTQRELPFLYQNAAINIFASECENCPHILLEALSVGVPCVVSNRPPMPEFGGDAVVYFDPANPEDLAVQLASLLDDEPRLTDLARRAQKRSLLYDGATAMYSTWNAIQALVS